MKYCYDPKIYTIPFYEGDTVYYESGMFIDEQDSVNLLFNPTKIEAVLSYGLDKKFINGKDFIIKGNAIVRLKGSEMPFFGKDRFFLDKPNMDNVPVEIKDPEILKLSGGKKWFYFGEGSTFTKYQFAVVYKHDDQWQGTKPIYQGDKLKKFINKLTSKEDATLLFFGDSITYGCNSSGTDVGDFTAPHADSYPVMVHKMLEEIFSTKIKYVNTSIGGKDCLWALETVDENVSNYHPDLVVLAFGMNNPYFTKEEYSKWLNEIIQKIEEKNKGVEIIIVSPTVPNVYSSWFGNQKDFIKSIKEIHKDNVAIVDMVDMHLDLIKYGKKFWDMTGNNVNHPNDFLARIYAQSILKTIVKKY